MERLKYSWLFFKGQMSFKKQERNGVLSFRTILRMASKINIQWYSLFSYCLSNWCKMSICFRPRHGSVHRPSDWQDVHPHERRPSTRNSDRSQNWQSVHANSQWKSEGAATWNGVVHWPNNGQNVHRKQAKRLVRISLIVSSLGYLVKNIPHEEINQR